MNRGRGGARGGGRGGRSFAPQGPPDTILEMGSYMHPCEGDIVCKSINTKVPYFNAPIYLENKSQIGKVDEILGPMNDVYFTIKPSEGIVATSFKAGDKFYIGSDKLLPLDRFLPKPKTIGGPRKPSGGPRGGAAGRGGGRGGAPMRGGRGGGRGGAPSRGGRGAPRGGGGGRGRGGFRGGRF